MYRPDNEVASDFVDQVQVHLLALELGEHLLNLLSGIPPDIGDVTPHEVDRPSPQRWGLLHAILCRRDSQGLEGTIKGMRGLIDFKVEGGRLSFTCGERT